MPDEVKTEQVAGGQAVIPRMPRAEAFARASFGLALLAAAGAKAHASATASTEPMGLEFLPSGLQVVLITFESGFGVWFLSGVAANQSRFVAITLSAVLAGVSAYKGATGEASCGCFGSVSISPWWSFSLSLAVLVTLLVSRLGRPSAPAGRAFLARHSWGRFVRVPPLAALVISMAGIGVSTLHGYWIAPHRGGVPAGLAGLKVVQPTIDVGLLAEREVASAVFELINNGDSEYRIADVKTSCGCTVAELDRRVLRPHETCRIEAKVKSDLVPRKRDASTSRFTTAIKLNVESNTSSGIVGLEIAGTVQSRPTLLAVPGILNFGPVSPGRPASKTIRFRGPTAMLNALPAEVGLETKRDQTIHLGYLPNHDSRVSEKEVVFTLADRGREEYGPFEARLLITRDGPSQLRLLVPVRGEVSAPVTVQPPRLLFTHPKQEATLVFRSPLRDLRLRSIDTDLPVDVTTSSAAHDNEIQSRVTVRVSVREGVTLPFFASDTIKFRFENPDYQVGVPVVLSLSGRSRD